MGRFVLGAGSNFRFRQCAAQRTSGDFEREILLYHEIALAGPVITHTQLKAFGHCDQPRAFVTSLPQHNRYGPHPFIPRTLDNSSLISLPRKMRQAVYEGQPPCMWYSERYPIYRPVAI